MRIKKSLKSSGLFGCVVIAALLAGCSGHGNPLRKKEHARSATFLVNASVAAEKELKLIKGVQGGYYYAACMQGRAKKALCRTLYQAMVAYAKTTKNFNKLTLSDLTDQRVFNTLKEDYEREQFNHIN